MSTRSKILTAAFLSGFTLSNFLAVTHVAAQTTLALLPESSLTITGRSNESDWDVSSTVIEGELILADMVDPVSVTGLTISVPAAEIQAPKGLIMDRIMQGSLKSDEYPTISFELTSAGIPEAPSDTLNLIVNGKFTLTGTTRDITIDLQASIAAGGNPRYTGSFPLTMTDYGMETPTAMFGQLRVHRDIVIVFDLLFSE